jgi:Tfp pilus assembly protein PilV
MDKIFKNEKGFSGVEVLLAVLVLALIGFGGYYVWHAQHTTNTNNTSKASSRQKTNPPPHASTEPSTTPNMLDISEWGVRLTFADADKVSYTISNNQAAFSLKSSVTSIADCQDLQSALLRTSTGPASSSVHKVDNYYYHIAGDPAPCSDPNGDNGSINQQRNKIILELNSSTVTAN